MPTANLIRATENYPQVLVSQQLAGTETTLYTCPANKSVVITYSVVPTIAADIH